LRNGTQDATCQPTVWHTSTRFSYGARIEFVCERTENLVACCIACCARIALESYSNRNWNTGFTVTRSRWSMISVCCRRAGHKPIIMSAAVAASWVVNLPVYMQSLCLAILWYTKVTSRHLFPCRPPRVSGPQRSAYACLDYVLYFSSNQLGRTICLPRNQRCLRNSYFFSLNTTGSFPENSCLAMSGRSRRGSLHKPTSLSAFILASDVEAFTSCISYCEFSSAASCRISYPIVVKWGFIRVLKRVCEYFGIELYNNKINSKLSNRKWL